MIPPPPPHCSPRISYPIVDGVGGRWAECPVCGFRCARGEDGAWGPWREAHAVDDGDSAEALAALERGIGLMRAQRGRVDRMLERLEREPEIAGVREVVCELVALFSEQLAFTMEAALGAAERTRALMAASATYEGCCGVQHGASRPHGADVVARHAPGCNQAADPRYRCTCGVGSPVDAAFRGVAPQGSPRLPPTLRAVPTGARLACARCGTGANGEHVGKPCPDGVTPWPGAPSYPATRCPTGCPAGVEPSCPICHCARVSAS